MAEERTTIELTRRLEAIVSKAQYGKIMHEIQNVKEK